MSAQLVEIMTTVASEEDAEALSRRLVEEALVACASFFPIRSIYRWKGEIADDPEYQLHLKTLPERAAAAELRLAELHPYDVPAILRLDVSRAADAYAAWVADCVGGGPELR